MARKKIQTAPEVHFWTKREESGLVRTSCDILVPTDTKTRHVTIFYREITCPACLRRYDLMHPDPDAWPVRIDSAYGETELTCDGWVRRVTGSGAAWHEPCRAALSGSTLYEIRRVLESHLASTEHVEHPLADLNDRVAKDLRKKR